MEIPHRGIGATKWVLALGMANGDPDFWSSLKRIVEKGFQVKLGPGVVSKTTRVVLALCLVWVIVFARLTGTWGDAGYLIGGGILTWFCVWWINKTHAFAEKHPGTALLEGAQLLQWQRIATEAKGVTNPPGPSRIVVVHPKELGGPG